MLQHLPGVHEGRQAAHRSEAACPELGIEEQVEIEKEKVKAKAENLRSRFTHVAKQLADTEKQLSYALGLSQRTPQLIDIQPKQAAGTSESWPSW